jgi:hypothetical protein
LLTLIKYSPSGVGVFIVKRQFFAKSIFCLMYLERQGAEMPSIQLIKTGNPVPIPNQSKQVQQIEDFLKSFSSQLPE